MQMYQRRGGCTNQCQMDTRRELGGENMLNILQTSFVDGGPQHPPPSISRVPHFLPSLSLNDKGCISRSSEKLGRQEWE